MVQAFRSPDQHAPHATRRQRKLQKRTIPVAVNTNTIEELPFPRGYTYRIPPYPPSDLPRKLLLYTQSLHSYTSCQRHRLRLCSFVVKVTKEQWHARPCVWRYYPTTLKGGTKIGLLLAMLPFFFPDWPGGGGA